MSGISIGRARRPDGGAVFFLRNRQAMAAKKTATSKKKRASGTTKKQAASGIPPVFDNRIAEFRKNVKESFTLVGAVFKERREEEGYSLAEVAIFTKAYGLGEGEISKIENGETENIEFEHIFRLCYILDIQIEYVLEVMWEPFKNEPARRPQMVPASKTLGGELAGNTQGPRAKRAGQ